MSTLPVTCNPVDRANIHAPVTTMLCVAPVSHSDVTGTSGRSTHLGTNGGHTRLHMTANGHKSEVEKSIAYENPAFCNDIEVNDKSAITDTVSGAAYSHRHIFVSATNDVIECSSQPALTGTNDVTSRGLSEIDIQQMTVATSNTDRSDSLLGIAMVKTAQRSQDTDPLHTAGTSTQDQTEGVEVKSGVSKVPTRADSTVSGSSVASEGTRGCRICWNGDEREPLIQPCSCTGSSANVHVSCLKKWLQVTNKFQCEVCGFKYRSISAFKPISKWTWKCSKTSYLSQLEATLILLGIVTPPLICGIVLCIQKIVESIDYPEHAWKTAALMTLVVASSFTYFTAFIYFCRKFGLVFHQWLRSNQIQLVSLGGVDTVIEQPDEDCTGDQGQERQPIELTSGERYSVWSIS